MDQFDHKVIRLIAIYARVSTARQEEEQTIENQLQELDAFAKKNGWTIVKQYIDEGWSGDILARPKLDELRQDVKEKLWDAVLIYDPDRLARRYSYQELIMDELREAGAEVLFVTTPVPRNSEERILYGVKGIFAEYERVKIAERFRIGKLRKVRDGHILTSEAPYGLTYIAKRDREHGYFVVDEKEVPVLRMIYEWVDEEGLTVRGVAKRLLERGIKPRKSKRGVWSTSTLSHILHNKTYIGEAHYGKSYGVVPKNPYKIAKYKRRKKTSRRVRAEEEWIKIPVPPILDREQFLRVQERLRSNFVQAKRNTKNEYLLSGRLWCGCGARRTGSGVRQGRNLYYGCIDRVRSFPFPSTCTDRVINARVTDDLVWRKIVELMSSPQLLRKQIERWLEKQRGQVEHVDGDVKAIEKELARCRHEEDRYNKAYGAGLFSLEQLKDYAMSVREKIGSLEAEKAAAEAKGSAAAEITLPDKKGIEEFCQKARVMLKVLKFADRQAIVRGVIERAVAAQGELCVVGRIPAPNNENNSNVAFCSIDRYGMNTNRHGFDQTIARLIPFAFSIKLPPPRYRRSIVSRDQQGRILRSVAAE